MSTQAQVQSTLEAMKKGKRGLLLSKDKRGTGRSYAQQMFQVGKGFNASDLTVSPAEQSAAEARSQLMNQTATKRKAHNVYHPTPSKKPKQTSKGRPKSNSNKKKGGRRKSNSKRSNKKGKKTSKRVSTKKSGFFARKK